MRSGYLLLYLSAAWMAGIALGHELWKFHVLRCSEPGTAAWIAAIAAATAGYAAARRLRRNTTSLWVLISLSALLGAWRYSAHPQSPCLSPEDVAFYDQRNPIVIAGAVSSYPDIRDASARYVISTKSLESGGHTYHVRGKVLVTTGPEVRLHYGDEVEARGVLSRPEAGPGFDYRAYLARKGIYAVMRRARVEKTGGGKGSPFWRAMYRAREFSQKEIARMMPEPEASFLMGILLGIESNIPRELYDRFNRTGVENAFSDLSVQKNLAVDLSVADRLDQVIGDLEAFPTRRVKEHDPDDFHRLRSIPGVGKILAMTFLYEIDDVNRFPRVQLIFYSLFFPILI
jgi:competence protein ComEC